MSEYVSMKQIMKDEVKSLAKDLAWKSLSKKQRQAFTEQAKEKQAKKMTALALKCVKDAADIMSDPSYVSRADSSVYIKDGRDE